MGRIVTTYQQQVSDSEIEPDPAQARAVAELDRLATALANWLPDRKGLLSVLRRSRKRAPRGIYIYGGAGRGKTMLMDLFYETAEVAEKTRFHFHEFMAEAHERIARGRATTDGDPIPFVANEMAAEAVLLCLDEFQVTDIADAMILGRLFKVLFERGVVVVATSNTKPADLYNDGLNRQLFLPFIALLESNVDALELRSAKDYRLDKLAGRQLYFTPVGAAARIELDRHWDRLTGRHPSHSVDLPVKGRVVHVPCASMGVARFNFADLCEKPLGSLDYLHIAHAFHTILIDEIPVMSPDRRNEARRFINLIDSLYDQRVCLIAAAAAEPRRLYPAGDGALAFERTVSRLMEMRSEAYLARLSRGTASTLKDGR